MHGGKSSPPCCASVKLPEGPVAASLEEMESACSTATPKINLPLLRMRNYRKAKLFTGCMWRWGDGRDSLEAPVTIRCCMSMGERERRPEVAGFPCCCRRSTLLLLVRPSYTGGHQHPRHSSHQDFSDDVPLSGTTSPHGLVAAARSLFLHY
nr:hypothetical protein Itr_chr10CG08360 [Ipomoea trifida]